jgi:hypothetical protein
MGYGQCSKCGTTNNIGWDSVRDRPKRLCRDCANKVQKAHRDKQRKDATRRQIRRTHSLTEEQLQWLEEQAAGKCMLCGEPPGLKPLCIDHGHADGAVRGLICTRCNIGLGFFKDDSDLFERAAAYLRNPPIRLEQMEA